MSQQSAAKTLAAWEHQLSDDGSVRLTGPKLKHLALLAVSLVFTVVGVFMVVEGSDGVLIGIASVVFFGVLGIPVFLWQILRGKPNITVTPDVLIINDIVPVPWMDVSRVSVIEVNGSTAVSVVFSSEEALIQALNISGPSLSLRLINTEPPEAVLPQGLKVESGVLCAWMNIVLVRYREFA